MISTSCYLELDRENELCSNVQRKWWEVPFLACRTEFRRRCSTAGKLIAAIWDIPDRCLPKISWFVITVSVARRFFLLLPLQLRSWSELVDMSTESSVQQNNYLDETLLWLRNPLFFLIHTPNWYSHLPSFYVIWTSSHLLLAFSVHTL